MGAFCQKSREMLASYWVHDLSPFAVEFAPGIGVRWYGLAYVVGFVLAYVLFVKWARSGWLGLPRERVGDFLTWVVLGAVLGGRLGYCLFYAWENVMRDPLYALRVWEGGMASHGGALGLGVAVAGFAWRHGVDGWRLSDAVAAAAPWGVAIGRVANFVNGELWGRPALVPWAVVFPQSGDMLPRHPYPLYASVLEGVVVGVVGVLAQRKFRRPGLVCGCVLCAYSAMRVVSEFFREPDDGVFWAWGFTQGQWMSAGTLVAGFAVLFAAMRRKTA